MRYLPWKVMHVGLPQARMKVIKVRVMVMVVTAGGITDDGCRMGDKV
jgi:hypothetical protein